MSTMADREMLIAKANEEAEIQRMLADACEDEGDLEGAADCIKLVILLRNLVAALTDQQEAEPFAWVDEEGRVVRVSEDGSGDGGWVSGHDRAIPDSWTPLHPAKPAAQPQVPEGIIKIERKFEYFSPVTAPKVVVYFAPDDWEAQDRFALWLSAVKEEGK